MKRILSIILTLSLLLSLVLTGCNTGDKTNASSITPASADGDKGEPVVTNDSVGYPDATIELTWLPQEAFDSPNKPVADYMKSKAVEFVKNHP
ncbi:MAG: hypothetical protein ACERKO_09815, partial [Acetanaerobacterium sp.]